jgi:hypothetical protein
MDGNQQFSHKKGVKQEELDKNGSSSTKEMPDNSTWYVMTNLIINDKVYGRNNLHSKMALKAVQ